MSKGKRRVMWAACHALFWLGHGWSRGLLRFDCLGFTYPVYNWLMAQSVNINNQYGLDVWHRPYEKESP